MQVDEQMIEQIASNVCQTMLGMELLRADLANHQHEQMTASVWIQGRKLRVLEILTDSRLMSRIAKTMFCAESDSLSEDELRDAFGEVANMIGGNVKAYFGEEAQLSQPVVGQASERSNLQGDDTVRATFECCGHQLTIVLRELDDCLNAG